MTTIALVGDRDDAVPAHRAIPESFERLRAEQGMMVDVQWVATDAVATTLDWQRYDGIWCVPATPYRDAAGALRAIRHAREHGLAFLGTCGGFQYGVLEYARHVLGWADAEHAETAPTAENPVITPLSCALVEVEDRVHFVEGTHLRSAYGQSVSSEGYRCRYALDPALEETMAAGDLRIAARDERGDVRALEHRHHPFYVMTLFQPERAALRRRLSPIVAAFARAAAHQACRRR